MKTLTKELQERITPQAALNVLKDGNARFVNNLRESRDYLKQAAKTAEGQYPFAVILSCIDSRTSSEIIFDQGLGDIFSIRIAGNIINEDVLGSMEFGCKAAGSKIIVVLGHSKCGAVKGACDNVEMGNLTALLAKIKLAVDEEETITDNRNSGNAKFVEKVAALNVKRTVRTIMERSPILSELIESGEIGIVGGNHDITTGQVEFYPNTLVLGSN